MSRGSIVPIGSRGYAHPEVLVTTGWVQDHLSDPEVRVIECDEDRSLYGTGHVPGAARLDWLQDLNDPLQRDYIGRERLQLLLRGMGVDQHTIVVFYGDKANWWAAFAFWILSLFGMSALRMKRLRIMDGGRWLWCHEGRPLSTDTPSHPHGEIVIGERNDRLIRAFRDDVLQHIGGTGRLVDVRSPEEYRGLRLHMPEYPNEGALRGGHIPGATNVPWEEAVDPATWTFRNAAELRAIYQAGRRLAPDDDILTYCRIGERSSHTWFVLTQLLGFTRVRNYDGSWCEWGNGVRLPIETGAETR